MPIRFPFVRSAGASLALAVAALSGACSSAPVAPAAVVAEAGIDARETESADGGAAAAEVRDPLVDGGVDAP